MPSSGEGLVEGRSRPHSRFGGKYARIARQHLRNTRCVCQRQRVADRGPEPRRYLKRPHLFGDRGKEDPLEWEEPADTLSEKADLAAAYYQHLVVFQLRRALEDLEVSTEDLGDKLGVTAETLRRKFRGEDRASLSDILGWALEYGVDLLPQPEDKDELLP